MSEGLFRRLLRKPGAEVATAARAETLPSLADDIAAATLSDLPRLREDTLTAMSGAKRRDRATIGEAYDRRAVEVFRSQLSHARDVTEAIDLYNLFAPQASCAVLGRDVQKEIDAGFQQRVHHLYAETIQGPQTSLMGHLANIGRTIQHTYNLFKILGQSESLAHLQDHIARRAQEIIQVPVPNDATPEQWKDEFVRLTALRQSLDELSIPKKIMQSLVTVFQDRFMRVLDIALRQAQSSRTAAGAGSINEIFDALKVRFDRSTATLIPKIRDTLSATVSEWSRDATNLTQCAVIREVIDNARYIDGSQRAELTDQMRRKEVTLVSDSIQRLPESLRAADSVNEIREVLDGMKRGKQRTELEERFDAEIAGIAQHQLRSSRDIAPLVELRPMLTRGGPQCHALLERLDGHAKTRHLRRIGSSETLPQLQVVAASLRGPGYPFTDPDRAELNRTLDERAVALFRKQLDTARGGLVLLGAALNTASRYVAPDSTAHRRIVQMAEQDVARYVDARLREVGRDASRRALWEQVRPLPLSESFMRNIEGVILRHE